MTWQDLFDRAREYDVTLADIQDTLAADRNREHGD